MMAFRQRRLGCSAISASMTTSLSITWCEVSADIDLNGVNDHRNETPDLHGIGRLDANQPRNGVPIP
jgi:hypothetical protein